MNLTRELAVVASILGAMMVLVMGSPTKTTLHGGRACQNAFDETWESDEFHATVLDSWKPNEFAWRSWVFSCTHQAEGSVCRGISEIHGNCDVFLRIDENGGSAWRP